MVLHTNVFWIFLKLDFVQHINKPTHTYIYIYIYIVSVYSPFSDRVGLPLHNIHIPSPFTSIITVVIYLII